MVRAIHIVGPRTEAEAAFAGVGKPDHFTNRTHCDECREHDDTLRARTRKTLRRANPGNAGWDPITYSSSQGIGYFFPALARFALLPDVWPGHRWYALQLLAHLAWDGRDSDLLVWCSPLQPCAVYTLLTHLAATRGDAAAKHGCLHGLRAAGGAGGVGASGSRGLTGGRHAASPPTTRCTP